ncbi:hypothetical protein Syun_027852 [Stephania yunnanensis]|uniref:Uncharacterized protein n=1 Tax=Stephania yunnanensis TaxID=152371 RepID=A0AAP0HQL3_9MAGN
MTSYLLMPHQTLLVDALPSQAPPRGTTDQNDYRGDEHIQDFFAQDDDDLDLS